MPGILIVDDHEGIRRNIRALLDDNDLPVCGEATNGEEALRSVRKLKPEVVLLDINMPLMNGIQAAYEIRRIAPATKVIFLTIHDAPETAAVVRLLADEYVTKSASGTRLVPIVTNFLRQSQTVTA
jgi:DNA-binding NarL/FixJ family response regulator